MMRAARQSCRICLNSLAFWKSVPDEMARVTGLEPATSGVTGRHSNRLSYTRALNGREPLGLVSWAVN